MGFFTTGNIVWTIIILAILVISIVALLRHSRRGKLKRAEAAERKVKSSEAALVKDETGLRAKLYLKKRLVHEVRVELGKKNILSVEKKIDSVTDVINDQVGILKDLTHIDKKDLAHLKHIDIDLAEEKSDRMHVSELIGHFEKVFGKLDSDAAIEAHIRAIPGDPDPIRQTVKQLVFTLVHMHNQFDRLVVVLKKQAKIVEKVMEGADKLKTGKLAKGESFGSVLQKTSDNLVLLESAIDKEEIDVKMVIENTAHLNKYLRQLDQVEAAKHLQEGPYLVVEGHHVDVVVDDKSRRTKVVGNGEKISLSKLPGDFIIGSDAGKCSIILGGEVSPHHAFFARDGLKLVVRANSDTKGLFIVRPSEGLLVLCKNDQDMARVKSLLDALGKDYDKRYDDLKKFLRDSQKKEDDVYSTATTKVRFGDRLIFPFGYELKFVEK
jgi:hypothetical protein